MLWASSYHILSFAFFQELRSIVKLFWASSFLYFRFYAKTTLNILYVKNTPNKVSVLWGNCPSLIQTYVALRRDRNLMVADTGVWKRFSSDALCLHVFTDDALLHSSYKLTCIRNLRKSRTTSACCLSRAFWEISALLLQFLLVYYVAAQTKSAESNASTPNCTMWKIARPKVFRRN